MNTSAARELRMDASGSVRGFSLRTELCPVLCCSCRVHRQLALPQPPHPAVFHAADDDFLFLASEALTGNVRANENSRSRDHVIYSELARHSEQSVGASQRGVSPNHDQRHHHCSTLLPIASTPLSVACKGASGVVHTARWLPAEVCVATAAGASARKQFNRSGRLHSS